MADADIMTPRTVSADLRACSLTDLPEEGALRVELAGQAVCIARSQGHVFALSDLCTHGAVALSEGDVDDGAIECWLHGGRFDLRSGSATAAPATKPVATYAVTIDGDDVLVRLQILRQ